MKKIFLLLTICVTLLFPCLSRAVELPGMVTIGKESMHLVTRAITKDLPMIITDPQGRRLGFDPRTNKPVFEFKGGYEPGGIYEDGEWHTEAFINLTPGEFTVEVFNQADQEFSLYITTTSANGFATYECENWGPAGYVFTYKVILNGDGPARAVKFATPAILKEDILIHKPGFGEGLTTSLIKKVEAVEDSIARGNKTAASNQIDAFINEVQAQTSIYFEEKRNGRTYTMKEPIFKRITRNTSRLLIEDAQYIKDHL